MLDDLSSRKEKTPRAVSSSSLLLLRSSTFSWYCHRFQLLRSVACQRRSLCRGCCFFASWWLKLLLKRQWKAAYPF